ncbi:FecR family protein [Kriegella aquimaris]|uniref:FecR family protein n=1 Tax=Kriegella aquimaris TaxID=192904 RepID=A0A1G9V571_9FLAO|nr:FecR family protein [Kriegella aquimaris]SDM67015.1 FecR family protein [Kriegella aquimaris]
MISKEIENCIVKYLSQSADVADLDLLNKWIVEEDNQVIFKTFVKTNFAINLAMDDPNKDNIRERLLKEIRKEKSSFYRRRFSSVAKYAAIAILFLGLGLLVKQSFFGKSSNHEIVPREDVITLQLGNGDVRIINEDDKSYVIRANGNKVGLQKGDRLIYNKSYSQSELVYNTLRIPNGKRFSVILSDGTKVHLNSGSSLTYPIEFIKDRVRKVQVAGEAYFEVTKDENHLFVVNTQGLNVQVYGTKFNVSNYSEDDAAEVVLVEGEVSLSDSDKIRKKGGEFFLKPGFMGVFNKMNKKISNKKVNTDLYTSWMNGNLVFRNATFENIIQKLERHYNVVIINNNKDLGQETFNATIETEDETIEQVFNYFNKVYQIEYQIVENKIIIN